MNQCKVFKLYFGVYFRFLDVADLFPQMNPGGTGRIMKPELRQTLNKLMFYMDEDEFEKLWQKWVTNLDQYKFCL